MFPPASSPDYDSQMAISEKLKALPWGFVALVTLLSLIGVGLLYSAGGASWEPWASRQLFRMIPGILLMLGIAIIDIRFWYKGSYLVYAGLLLLLMAVAVIGHIGMGAQRWISFGSFVLQPSEHMKVALMMALAAYFHNLSYDEIGNPLRLLIPVGLLALPAGLVLIQPNLGTATLMGIAALVLFFLAGVRLWKFALVGAGIPFAAYAAWQHLHDYQRARLTTFLDPEKDPLGSGYNIIQSKIALGSGGIFGKGFAMGTQSQLNFLPEKHTDFIFVVLAEEFGLAGAAVLLLLLMAVIVYGYNISLHARHQYGRLLGLGLTTSFFLYILTNVSMVMGLIPVVGIPLPLISYGGSTMLAFYIACGLIMSVHVHKDARFGRTNID